jgi:hypothetical protein
VATVDGDAISGPRARPGDSATEECEGVIPVVRDGSIVESGCEGAVDAIAANCTGGKRRVASNAILGQASMKRGFPSLARPGTEGSKNGQTIEAH